MYDKLFEVIAHWVELIAAYFIGRQAEKAKTDEIREELDASKRKIEALGLGAGELDARLLQQREKLPRRTRIPHD